MKYSAAQSGCLAGRQGRVKALTPHHDVLLCHPSRESITVSSRLAAQHEERQAHKERRGEKWIEEDDERREHRGREMKSGAEAELQEKTCMSNRRKEE